MGLKRHDLPKRHISAHLPQVGPPRPLAQLEEGCLGLACPPGPHLVATLPRHSSSLSSSLGQSLQCEKPGPGSSGAGLSPLGVSRLWGHRAALLGLPESCAPPRRGEHPVLSAISTPWRLPPRPVDSPLGLTFLNPKRGAAAYPLFN